MSRHHIGIILLLLVEAHFIKDAELVFQFADVLAHSIYSGQDENQDDDQTLNGTGKFGNEGAKREDDGFIAIPGLVFVIFDGVGHVHNDDHIENGLPAENEKSEDAGGDDVDRQKAAPSQSEKHRISEGQGNKTEPHQLFPGEFLGQSGVQTLNHDIGNRKTDDENHGQCPIVSDFQIEPVITESGQ